MPWSSFHWSKKLQSAWVSPVLQELRRKCTNCPTSDMYFHEPRKPCVDIHLLLALSVERDCNCLFGLLIPPYAFTTARLNGISLLHGLQDGLTIGRHPWGPDAVELWSVDGWWGRACTCCSLDRKWSLIRQAEITQRDRFLQTLTSSSPQESFENVTSIPSRN